MKVGDIVEIAVPSLESQWLHGLEVGQRVRVHQVFEDEPRRMTVEVGGELKMVLPSEVRDALNDMAERAARKWCSFIDTSFDDLDDVGKAMCLSDFRAVLEDVLGEPVAWTPILPKHAQDTGVTYGSESACREEFIDHAIPLYAPSIRPAEESEND